MITLALAYMGRAFAISKRQRYIPTESEIHLKTPADYRPKDAASSRRSPLDNLRIILAESRPLITPGNLPHAFVHRHGERISALGCDAETLVFDQRFEAAALIARSMLESLFNMVASTRRGEEFVKQKVIYEVRSCIRYAQKITPDPNGAVDGAICRMKQLESELLQKFQPTANFPDQNVWDCAVAAQHEDVYREIYFALSLHAHASTLGKVIRDARVDETLIRNTVSYCVIIASQQLLTVFNPGNRPAKLAQLETLAAQFKRWLLAKAP